MLSTEFGGALSSFAVTYDYQGETFNPTFKQGMIGYSIDDFLLAFAPPFPNHIKIDVDGIEPLIVGGAGKTLADPRLKSVSVEIDSEDATNKDLIISILGECGLQLIWSRNNTDLFPDKPTAKFYNYMFRRG